MAFLLDEVGEQVETETGMVLYDDTSLVAFENGFKSWDEYTQVQTFEKFKKIDAWNDRNNERRRELS